MFPTTRYAVNDKAAFITAFVLPATGALVSFSRCSRCRGSNILYAKIYWDPLSLIGRMVVSRQPRGRILLCCSS
ncbi:hypothetical protein V1507DRAFT_461491 [Lipomyces tetrasporus]